MTLYSKYARRMEHLVLVVLYTLAASASLIPAVSFGQSVSAEAMRRAASNAAQRDSMSPEEAQRRLDERRKQDKATTLGTEIKTSNSELVEQFLAEKSKLQKIDEQFDAMNKALEAKNYCEVLPLYLAAASACKELTLLPPPKELDHAYAVAKQAELSAATDASTLFQNGDTDQAVFILILLDEASSKSDSFIAATTLLKEWLADPILKSRISLALNRSFELLKINVILDSLGDAEVIGGTIYGTKDTMALWKQYQEDKDSGFSDSGFPAFAAKIKTAYPSRVHFDDLNHVQKGGLTLFQRAIGTDDQELVDFLARLGADVSKPSETGMTPLQYTIQRDRPDMVRLLLKLGADPKVVRIDGLDASGLAQKLGKTELAQQLESAQKGKQEKP